MIKDLFGIVVIVNKSCDFSEYLDYKNCKCRKRLVDKLADEYYENIEETSLVQIKSTKCKHNSCILYIVFFQYSLQLILEFVLILFTINTWILIKKMFLNMIMVIQQQINWLINI